MKIIVAGGAGFLGSNLCGRLLKDGHEVICIDNLITGSEENIEEFKSNPNFKFINADVSNAEILKQVEIASLRSQNDDGDKIDQIYHLASPASPSLKNPKSYHALGFETMQVNTTGTWNLCEWAVKTGATLLFASTSEIYGDPKEHPQKEDYRGNVSTIGPRSVYDESKRFGETIVSAFVRSKGLKGKIVRIFNVYGPKMSEDGRLVTEFINAALKNEPFPVFGDGTQTRSFMYVDDLVDGLVAAMEKGKDSEPYNIGNPDEFSVLELAEKIKQVTVTTSEVELKEPLPEDDPKVRCPDISKAKEDLGWEPQIGLEEGLKKTIEYFKASNG